MKKPIHFDMETDDPDDMMTLAILATHPRAELMSVTLMPGPLPEQVGLVKHVLGLLGIGVGPGPGPRVLSIGGRSPVQDDEKPSRVGFHEKWLGKWEPSRPTHRTEEDTSAR